ncbi:hypothetical protein RUM43_004246 [Polyplax serrata]|uniref:Uncharacterized protein n=1 Tax=Polyplax serrata TaxID=468196 RepID=A0AAN8XL64_POLSC
MNLNLEHLVPEHLRRIPTGYLDLRDQGSQYFPRRNFSLYSGAFHRLIFPGRRLTLAAAGDVTGLSSAGVNGKIRGPDVGVQGCSEAIPPDRLSLIPTVMFDKCVPHLVKSTKNVEAPVRTCFPVSVESSEDFSGALTVVGGEMR